MPTIAPINNMTYRRECSAIHKLTTVCLCTSLSNFTRNRHLVIWEVTGQIINRKAIILNRNCVLIKPDRLVLFDLNDHEKI